MKILHTVESYYPSSGGMAEVVRRLSELLVSMGHSVTVATRLESQRDSKKINGVTIEEFEIAGNYINGYRAAPQEIERYKEFLIDGDFDVITNFAAQQWATDLILALLDSIKAKKIFVPTGFSNLYAPEYQEYFEKMKRWMKSYDISIFLSNEYRDIEFARKHGIEKNIVIPNGASEKEFSRENDIDIRRKLKIGKDHFLILHVGSHTGLKGHAEAMKIFNSANIKNSTLIIVGGFSTRSCYYACRIKSFLVNLIFLLRRNSKRIIVKPLPREEVVAAFKAADLFLFPSNIECSPIVLFEAMASSTPYLVTDVGNSKEIVSWSKSGIVLPTKISKEGYSKADIKKSSVILEDIYRDNKKRKQLAASGLEAWKSHFTWEKIAKKYEKLYIEIVSESG